MSFAPRRSTSTDISRASGSTALILARSCIQGSRMAGGRVSGRLDRRGPPRVYGASHAGAEAEFGGGLTAPEVARIVAAYRRRARLMGI
jgi:hypothetical protein